MLVPRIVGMRIFFLDKDFIRAIIDRRRIVMPPIIPSSVNANKNALWTGWKFHGKSFVVAYSCIASVKLPIPIPIGFSINILIEILLSINLSVKAVSIVKNNLSNII